MSKTLKYGVVGFSRNQFDQQAAHKILDELFQSIRTKHSDKTIEIVSGYTNMGIPRIAYKLADQYGFITVGFSAKQALRGSFWGISRKKSEASGRAIRRRI